MKYPFTYPHHLLSSSYDTYLKNSDAVPAELCAFYEGFELGKEASLSPEADQEAQRLLRTYQELGHTKASINPLAEPQHLLYLDITPPLTGKTQTTLNLFNTPNITLGALKEHLDKLYCGSIGYEFSHCSQDIQKFIQEFIETNGAKETLNPLDTYKLLAEAELFENFLHTRFPGQKRFSLEGLESSIVLMQEMIKSGEDKGFKGTFLGMAHRGRLNFLSNIFHKPLCEIFDEFSKETKPLNQQRLGDVKYHLGAYYKTPKGMELFLTPNPSHLEAVNPVIQGMSYAYQTINSKKALTVMIHGDASFAGQGVVYETLQLSKLKGFDPKGVIHLILNNQIGFTALPKESRITPYASDLAKSFNIPIFHINSDDIEAVKQIGKLAIELLERFHIDIMIDLIGYRRWGHNESDEPSFTQPQLYQKIKNKKTVLTLFEEKLSAQDSSVIQSLEKIKLEINQKLDTHLKNPLHLKSQPPIKPTLAHLPHVDLKHLQKIGHALTNIPSSFNTHPKLAKLFKERKETLDKAGNIDFATAEALAFGLVCDKGASIRLVGQDAARGTFSQRHALLIDQVDETPYNLFSSLLHPGAHCEIINSPLSEYAVLGFEYGYSKLATYSLNLWEAQFGDFANGAQIIIDQFIASGHTKWEDQSNLTLLLPHGYEGQGPEHSSARIERFLELGAENNLRITLPTTPAQYFLILKEQLSAVCPLILFTPKALLRLPEARSPLQALTGSFFEPIIDDLNTKATVIVLTYGKIYYDLPLQLKPHISVIRIEQLYPLPLEALQTAFKQRKDLKKIVLLQDEPINMGAYYYLNAHLKHLEVIARPPASSPATGFFAIHHNQIQDLITQFEAL